MSRIRAVTAPVVGRAVALGDQALSGLSNFLAVALVARSATPLEFGQFSVVYALFIAAVGLARHLWGTRVALTSAPNEALERAGNLVGTTLVLGPVVGCAIAVPSMLLTGVQALPICAVLAVALPIVMAQDLCRHAGVAAGRPLVAAFSDLIWVVAILIGFALRPAVVVSLVIWAAGALVGLIAALCALHLRPVLTTAFAPLRQRHATAEAGAVGFVATSFGTYAVLGLATASVGATAAGALRGAATVMAPVNTLFGFAWMALLPVTYRASPERHPRLAVQTSLVLASLTVGWGITVLFVPPGLGEVFLGASWTGIRSVLPWVVIEYLFVAVSLGPLIGLQARRKARLYSTALCIGVGLTLVGAVLATVLGESASAYAAAAALSAAFAMACGWFIFLRQLVLAR